MPAFFGPPLLSDKMFHPAILMDSGKNSTTSQLLKGGGVQNMKKQHYFSLVLLVLITDETQTLFKCDAMKMTNTMNTRLLKTNGIKL